MGTARSTFGVLAAVAWLGGVACSSDDPSSGEMMNAVGAGAGGAGMGGAGTVGAAGMPAAGAPGAGGASGASGGASGAGGMGGAGGAGSPALPDGGAAEGDASAPDDGGGATRPGTGPGDWGPGDYPPDLTAQTYLEIESLPGQDGNVRQYKVHVPPSYDPNTPAAVVFCFHGLGQNAVMFCTDGADMVEKSDAEGFILVMPNGFQNSWNGGTCCGGAVSGMLDDVGFVRAVFEEVKQHLNVDLGRVYATGLSNGGYISYRLACEASDIFAAVAPGAGAIGMADIGGGTSATSDIAACEPEQPVSVLDMHGTEDFLVAYSTQKPSLDRIAGANGCSTTTTAATQPMSAGDTTCISYEGCPSGVDVTGCSVQGGGHSWFGNDSCGTGAGAGGCSIVGANSDTLVNTDAAWEFFEAHMR
jgi:polyhydroxybutyrate depolymerase